MAKKILIIDDNRDISDELAFKLRGHGYEVLTANSGKEGLEIALKEAPHLILLDFMMPVMDGPETALQLKSDDKTKECFFTGIIILRYIRIKSNCATRKYRNNLINKLFGNRYIRYKLIA